MSAVTAGGPPRTLAIDIGGTGLKASVLDETGRMLVKRVRSATPYPCPPSVLVDALAKLVAPLPAYTRASIGFPGVVRHGRVVTAPHFEHDGHWRGYPLAETMARRLGKPARLLNDAEVQGLGIIKGQGLEVVLTLGTGVGSAIFDEGRLAPHLELAHHSIRKGMTYNEYVGEAAKKDISRKKWNARVLRVIATVSSLVNYDVLFIGGGNADNITVALPKNVFIASNDAGLTGGIRLWDDRVWDTVSES